MDNEALPNPDWRSWLDELVALARQGGCYERADDPLEDTPYERAVGRFEEVDDRAAYEAVTDLVDDVDERVRMVVPDVLRVLGGVVGLSPEERRKAGWRHPMPYQEETIALLARRLETETDEDVLQSIAFANKNMGDPRLAAFVLRHKRHADSDVRWGVMNALAALWPHGGDLWGELVAFTRDADDDIRNWATFYVSDPESAPSWVKPQAMWPVLWRRAWDAHDETRAEAVLGLARWRHPDAVHAVLNVLTPEFHWTQPWEAATILASPLLYPALIRIRDLDSPERAYQREDLEEAIAACTPRPGR